MQLGGLGNDLFKESFVFCFLFVCFFLFFCVCFLSAITCTPVKLQCWALGSGAASKRATGAWWLLNKKSAVHGGCRGFNDRLGTKLINLYFFFTNGV